MVSRDIAQLEHLTGAHHIENLIEGDLLKHLVSLLILVEADAIIVNHAEQVMIHVIGKKSVLIITFC